MTTYAQQPRAQWDSTWNYLLVTTGSVVGIGNIFQFPHYVAKYGAIFILFYVLFEIVSSIPIILAEIFIGRRGKQNPVGAISVLSMESGARKYWRWVGWLCFVILFLTFTYYSFSVATPLQSLIHSLTQLFSSTTNTEAIGVTNYPWLHGLYFLIFLLATLLVVVRGINRGLEGISRIVVPTFFILFFALAIYASIVGNFPDALNYLTDFRPEDFSYELLFSALTYAFFKLNTAMGCMIVYGSYLPHTTLIGRSTFMIAIFDAIASLLSYFIIYPLLLIKHTSLENVTYIDYASVLDTFLNLPHGLILAALFFLGTTLAAWMPSIAFAEGAIVTLIERANLNRRNASLLVVISAFVLGILMIFMNQDLLGTWSLSELIQNITVKILTPISALLIAIFAGWVVKTRISASELQFGDTLFAIWKFLIRFIAPILILILLLMYFYSLA